jgi:hypothetical protein
MEVRRKCGVFVQAKEKVRWSTVEPCRRLESRVGIERIMGGGPCSNKRIHLTVHTRHKRIHMPANPGYDDIQKDYAE